MDPTLRIYMRCCYGAKWQNGKTGTAVISQTMFPNICHPSRGGDTSKDGHSIHNFGKQQGSSGMVGTDAKFQGHPYTTVVLFCTLDAL